MNDEIIEPALPCAGKLAFDSKKQATGSATTIAYQRGIKLKAYKCTHCMLWHLTSA